MFYHCTSSQASSLLSRKWVRYSQQVPHFEVFGPCTRAPSLPSPQGSNSSGVLMSELLP